MRVPTYVEEKAVQENGFFTEPWQILLEQLLQNLQQAISDEGFLIPSVSSDANSVTPPAAGGQLSIIEASFGTDGGALAGTLVFDPAEVNGGTVSDPNGQLKILLRDGVFHPVTNT